MKLIRLRAWILALRLRTLPLALSCVLTGGALAALSGTFRTDVMILAGLTTVLLQILSNLANDLGDTIKGVDNAERVGPKRATQSGAISSRQMKTGVITAAVLAFASGLALLMVAIGSFNTLFFSFLGTGLAAIVSAMAYTLGSKPYGYLGLGDVFVVLFFGLIGVGGVAFLMAGFVDWKWIFPSLTIGLLAASVLNLNNMRDAENDRQHGKMTLASRLGFGRAKAYHNFILLLSVTFLCVFIWLMRVPRLALALLPMAVVAVHLVKIRKISVPADLDPELKKMALTAFVASLLMFIIALVG